MCFSWKFLAAQLYWWSLYIKSCLVQVWFGRFKTNMVQTLHIHCSYKMTMALKCILKKWCISVNSEYWAMLIHLINMNHFKPSIELCQLKLFWNIHFFFYPFEHLDYFQFMKQFWTKVKYLKRIEFMANCMQFRIFLLSFLTIFKDLKQFLIMWPYLKQNM